MPAVIPDELLEVRQWTHSYNSTELKRPFHSEYIPNGALTFAEATKIAHINKLYRGFYVTRKDDYVLGDIDHVKDPLNPWSELPLEITMLLRAFPTYCERSPSGNGIRFIYKLHNKGKECLTGSYYLLNKSVTEVEKFNRKGYQINIDRPWMTITGNALPYSVPKIALIPIPDLEQAFAIRKTETKTCEIQQKQQQIDLTNLPSFTTIVAKLHSIPLDRNPRLQRAYQRTFNEDYHHYTFWMKILMAANHYAKLTDKEIECLHEITQWSRRDTVAYTSDEDVLKHWMSLDNKDGSISYLSLIKLANECKLRWPRPRKQTKAEQESNRPFLPLITEYTNFKALIAYYNINLYRDEDNPNILYISGDKDIVDTYFMMYEVKEHYEKYYGPFTKDTLTPALYVLAQDKGFIGMSHSQMNQFIKTYLAETLSSVNLVRLYFDTPFMELPERYQENRDMYYRSNIDFLFDSLEIDYLTDDKGREDEMYKTYYKCWLMGFVRNLYFRDSPYSNNCVLLLTGPEQIRKTSHFRYLLPKFMRQDRIAFTTHGFSTETSIRDVTKLAASNLILCWDELEQYLDADTESSFKKIIDGNPQKIIDKYEVIDKAIQPTAIYGGTSNQREFRLGPEGSRRLFNIPVKWVDTDQMNKVCWHRLINLLKQEMELGLKSGDVPWLLTEEQLSYQMELHNRIRAKNTFDYALEEVFNFSEPIHLRQGGVLQGITSLQTDKSGRFKTTREVADILARYGFGQLTIKRPALVKSLERLCGDYTGTRKFSIELLQPKCTIRKGQAAQNHYKKWLMPPLRPEILQIFRSTFVDGGET